MLAKCLKPSCGYSFEGNIFQIENVRNARLEGVFDICPKCGSRAKYPDGVYDFDEKGFETFLRTIPQDDLYKIQKAAMNAATTGTTQEEFDTEISNINPTYLKKFKELLKDKDFQFWINAILKIVQLILQLT